MGNVLSGLSSGMEGVLSLRLIITVASDFKAFLPPQSWNMLEALGERVTPNAANRGSLEHAMAPGKIHPPSSPVKRGPGVVRMGPGTTKQGVVGDPGDSIQGQNRTQSHAGSLMKAAFLRCRE